MPIAPQFEYFLSNTINAVDEHSRIWNCPLPMHRKMSRKTAGTFVSYGEYFSAIRSFLAKDNFHTIASAISRQIKAPVRPEDVKKICVYLEKHGEFYHPARVETFVHGTGISFVLNVAISDAGKNCIKREYRSLEKLNEEFPFSFIPEIYGKNEVHTSFHLYLKFTAKMKSIQKIIINCLCLWESGLKDSMNSTYPQTR
ncbi:MAG: hypothetical protein JRI32_11030 [Deltaproteobacteria bacterium]|nr:hypothetical protein [Deltaproteobacteria bacterium]